MLCIRCNGSYSGCMLELKRLWRDQESVKIWSFEIDWNSRKQTTSCFSYYCLCNSFGPQCGWSQQEARETPKKLTLKRKLKPSQTYFHVGSISFFPKSGLPRARASLLENELQRCVDGHQVLRVGATTQLPFSEPETWLQKKYEQAKKTEVDSLRCVHSSLYSFAQLSAFGACLVQFQYLWACLSLQLARTSNAFLHVWRHELRIQIEHAAECLIWSFFKRCWLSFWFRLNCNGMNGLSLFHCSSKR